MDETQIFADNAMLASTDNVWHSLHHPVKHRDNPVLVADRDWEGYVILQPGTVVYDEENERFQMWYNSQPSRDKPDAGHNLCYATSTDGLQWDKPELGFVEFEGSTANNILLQDVSWTHCVLKDDADADGDRRYKLLYWPEDGSGIYAAFSPDGVHWKLCDELAALTKLAQH